MKQLISQISKYFRWYLLLLLIIFGIVLWSITLSEDQTGLTFAALNVLQGDGLLTTGTQYTQHTSSSPSECHWRIWQV
jgi:hypothetical protein